MIHGSNSYQYTTRYYKTGLETGKAVELVRDFFKRNGTEITISGNKDATCFRMQPWHKVFGYSIEGVIGQSTEGALISLTIGEIKLFRYLQICAGILLLAANFFFLDSKAVQQVLWILGLIPLLDFIIYYWKKFKFMSFMNKRCKTWRRIGELEYYRLRQEVEINA